MMQAMPTCNPSGGKAFLYTSSPNHNNTTNTIMELIEARNATCDKINPMAARLTMTLGILFNVIALIILAKAYNRFRRRSKATFLLFASSLVATDLAGHVVSGALVLRRHSQGPSSLPGDPADPDALCLFLGWCMVFFGLCPLFLGCAMAAERCMGITRPLLHARLVTTARAKIALTMIWLLALTVALLPFFSLGTYTYQYPWTWCFIRVMDNTRATDLAFVILFSSLAFSSLAVAFVCNTVSGVTLVKARLRRRNCHQRWSARSHDTEMVVQLVGIMVTSCICWSPLLVFGLISATRSFSDPLFEERKAYRGLMVTGVRMATCNQILDPWVYILLRRAILRKIYRITKKQASLKGSMFRSFHRDMSSIKSKAPEKTCDGGPDKDAQLFTFTL